MAAISDILSEYCIVNANGESLQPEADATAANHLISAKFPAFDVPENIVVCVDSSSEMERAAFRTKSGELHSSISLIKKAVSLFLTTKFRLRCDHSIALCSLHEQANVHECHFHESRKVGPLLSQLSEMDASQALDTCDLTSLLSWLRDQLPAQPEAAGLPPDYTLRLILIYGRSHTVPVIEDQECLRALMDFPFFFLDVFYLHEHPDATNKCEEIFDFFCALDQKDSSYVVEVTRSPTKLFDQMAQLLAHPLQRPPQSLANYKFEV